MPAPLLVRRRSMAGLYNPLSVSWHSAFWTDGPEFKALGLADGAAVSNWPDEAGTHDATQATALLQPVYRASSSSMGNRPVIEFDGVARFLDTAAFTAVSQPYEYAVVARWRATTAATRLFNGSGNLFDINATGVWRIFAGTGGATDGAPNTAKHFFRVAYDATDVLNIDGTNAVSANAGANTSTQITLASDTGGLNYGPVDIAFFGFKASALTATERSNLLAWSRRYYGTP